MYLFGKTMVNKFIKSLKIFIDNNKLISIILGLCIIFGTFIRFYNLKDSLMFQGDQGRDALIVSRIFTQKDLVFVGPVTSVGNMYLGPIYYYFMLPFLWITYPSPMGPVYAIATLSMVTSLLCFYIGYKLFNKTTGLIACIFYTFSHLSVTHARFSWNPNPTPLITLLTIYFLNKTFKNKKYWMYVAICLAILIQLHYFALLIVAGSGLIWLYQIKNASKKIEEIKNIIEYTIKSIIIVFTFNIPLILFDIKNNFLNWQAFIKIFSKEQSFTLPSDYNFFDKIFYLIRTFLHTSQQLFIEIFYSDISFNLLFIIISLFLMGLVYKNHSKNKKNLNILTILFLTSNLGASLYRHEIHDHYIIYLIPIVGLFYGLIVNNIWNRISGKIITIILIFAFLYTNFQYYPLSSMGWTIDDQQLVTKKIYDHLNKNEKYNLVLLSESQDFYGMNYRYFLSTTDKKPLSIYEFDQAETLVIINENQKNIDVTSLPVYEITSFPNKKIDDQFSINEGPTIIILRK